MLVLPPPVTAFFDADACNDPDALVATFSRDGSVTDEGRRHQGSEAIRNWWRAARDRYDYVASPVDVAWAGGQAKVIATVSSRFLGSPALLTYTFTISDGAIAGLEIGS